MKIPTRQTLIACGVTLAVASGSIAGARILAESGKGDLEDTTALSSDAVWLAGIQRVNSDGKSDRLALPNQANWIMRDQRTAPLEALVWADVINAPRARTPLPVEQTAPSEAEEADPTATEPEVDRTFAALTFEPLEAAPRVNDGGPLSIVPSRRVGSEQPSVQTVAFAPIPAPTTIIPSAAQQGERNVFQQRVGRSTKPLDEWDIR